MIGTELLDDPAADPAAVRAQLGDIARLNAWFGGRSAVTDALRPYLARARGATLTALDVGAGAGDILNAATAVARHDYGVRLISVALERSRAAAAVARGHGFPTVIGDGAALPFADASVDFVIVSQVLHHLPAAQAVRWLGALDRIARRAVIVADLRRSRLAMAGLWLACVPLGLDASTRRDAITSLKRGYTRAELDALLRQAGLPAGTRYKPWSRVVASWIPTHRVGAPESRPGHAPSAARR
jgi:ubiquinone/menaquinone biosynthesis C-methylase UbiE